MTFDPDDNAPQPPKRSWWRSIRFRRPAISLGVRRWRWRWILIALVGLFVLYYPVGALIVENIDDDAQFKPTGIVAGESRAVAIAADLVTREVDVHQWTPMQPFFMPAGILDNMPNFQRGIMAAMGRFSTEMMDQLGRTRGSSQTDRDLEQARGFLNEQPNIWIWQPSVSIWPSATHPGLAAAGTQGGHCGKVQRVRGREINIIALLR